MDGHWNLLVQLAKPSCSEPGYPQPLYAMAGADWLPLQAPSPSLTIVPPICMAAPKDVFPWEQCHKAGLGGEDEADTQGP